MQSNAVKAYNNGECGKNWNPWFSVQKNNAYGQVCWQDNKCSIAFRGSDDGPDWISNLAGNFNWGTVMGKKVPKGFLGEYEKLKTSPSWATWEWARYVFAT